MAVFRLLAAAELESYFEEIAQDALQTAISKRSSGKLTKASASLLAVQRAISQPGNTDEIKDKAFFERACADCEAAHARLIIANKGASSHNLLALLVPLGLDETKLDQQFLRDLNLFAVKRGDFAHKRVDLVQNMPNPTEDQKLLLSISRNLKIIETLLNEAIED